MKIITRAVLDWDGNVLEEDSYEYRGPITACKDSGSAPQPVDPWEQAGAQSWLNENTASYNAGLNRTNVENPLGSSTWNVSGGTGGGSPYGFGGSYGAPSDGAPTMSGPNYSYFGIPSGGGGGASFGLGGGRVSPGAGSTGSGAPTYTQTTQLAPQFQSLLNQPLDTSGMYGMPGGPNPAQSVGDAENSVFDQQMGLVAPQEAQQREQNDSTLAAEGFNPGSSGYDFGEQELGREQGFENSQIANNAVTTGMGELPMLYGLGSTSLNNQIAARNAPLNEFEELAGGGASPSTANSTDILGAFNNQYQGQIGAYNAQTASNNATTGAIGSLISSALLYAALA